MPIEGLSNRAKIPRLGKIHLGIKATTDKQGRPVEYPKAVDFFVCPDEVKEVYGDQPKELDIMFPVEDPEIFAPQYLKAYSLSQGLICRGDGRIAKRKIDISTGSIITSDTKSWEWHEVICDPQECEIYLKKSCKQVMNLLFLLPKVPGLGAWQVDTSSYHSIVNINSMVKLLKGILGRCSMIPLTLVLAPQEVSPQGTTKKTVHVLDIKQNIKLADLAKHALLPPTQVLLPEVSDEEIPEDLYPTGVLETTEEKQEPEKAPAKKPRSAPKKEAKAPDDDIPPPEEQIDDDDETPQTVEDSVDDNAKLVQRIHIEASNIDEGYYEIAIRPRIKATFKKDSSKDLTIEQLNTVLNWMTAKASESDKRAFVIKMKGLEFETQDDVLSQLIRCTGKNRGWTLGELDKTVISCRKLYEESKVAEKGDAEVEAFLNEDD